MAENTKVLDQMRNIGYDSFNTILNLGTLFVALGLYIVRFCLQFLVIWPLHKLGFISGTNNRKYFNQVFFKFLLVIFIEAYIEFLLSARLFFEAPDDSVDNTPLIRNLSWVILILCVIVAPGLYAWIMTFDTKYLMKSHHLKRRVHPLYSEIDIRSKFNLNFNLLFVIRRIVYIEIAFRLNEFPCQ
jgi:hypothetical protein